MNEDTSQDVVEETSQEPETTQVEPSVQQEEPQEESPQLYAGKYKSPEELEKAYQEAQRLISQQGNKIKSMEQPALPQDKQAILDELKALGVVTVQDLDRQKAVISQEAKDDAEIKSLGLTPSQERALRGYATLQDNLTKSMTDCWDELSSAIGGNVVSRKQNIKPKAGNRGTFQPKSSAEVASLSQEEYDKYWSEYASWKAGQ